jgi:hypothetical protein
MTTMMSGGHSKHQVSQLVDRSVSPLELIQQTSAVVRNVMSPVTQAVISLAIRRVTSRGVCLVAVAHNQCDDLVHVVHALVLAVAICQPQSPLVLY